MSDESASIIRQIDRLDHPDAILQDQILAKFSRQAQKVRPVVLANLPLVNARVRRALLRWLGDELTGEATLPLMRYVFDQRETIAEQTGREMAMALLVRRARQPQGPEEMGRLRGFAEDILGDDNPTVRRLGLTILAHVGNLSSAALAEAYLRDDHEEVRQAARRTMKVLEDAPDGPGAADRPIVASALESRLLNSAGPLQRQLIRRWRRHDEANEIAVNMLRQRAPLRLRQAALQILLESPDRRARPYLSALVLDEPGEDIAALALRLLARTADDGPPRPDELRAIRQALRSSDRLVLLAGFAAVAAFELRDFADQLIRAATSSDLSLSLEAAKTLGAVLDRSDHERCMALVDAVNIAERRRRSHSKQLDYLHLVAHLLTALRQIISPETIGVEAARRAALAVLRAGHNQKPLRVTGLQLLMAATPTEGLDELDRWTVDEASTLLPILDDGDRAATRRVGILLVRVAPPEMAQLVDGARKLWRSGAVDAGEVIVPLLDRADTEAALAFLEELAAGDDPAATEAARKCLRKRRNQGDFIDVEFFSDDD